MPDFLLEIGSEEVPSRFLKNEEKQLADLFASALGEAGLPYGKISTFSTPRRLAILIEDIVEQQERREEIISGPPVKIAYDADGKPSAALQGFLKLHGAEPDQVFIRNTPKGDYVALKRQTGGKPASAILAEICPQVLNGMSFPKRMRWGAGEQSWARPLHWFLALLDDQAIDFEFAGLRSGRKSIGHRVHASGEMEIASAQAWEKELLKAAIMPDRARREKKILDEGERLANAVNGHIAWKENLLAEVCGLVEHPVPIMGSFDAAYLELPPEVLLTSMEKHQKSFGVWNDSGQLLPMFLTVLNLSPKDEQLVRKGWEKVLKARLEDARFFWRADLATPLSAWQEKLESVIFLGPLGSMADKARRLEKLAEWLADRIQPELKADLRRAAALAKADLVSGMVGEFDSLQGIMGGIYAAKAGENSVVAKAIAEQYLPAGPDSSLPATPAGAMLAIINNADTLVGCFGLGMIPGGMADPQGLRRSALAIIRILSDMRWPLDLGALFDYARSLYGEKKWKLSPEEAKGKLLDFVKARMRNYFTGHGYPTAMVDAVLAREDDVAACSAKLAAMATFAKSANFESLAQIIKRVENILKKSESGLDDQPLDKSLLLEDAEKRLAAVLDRQEPEVRTLLEKGHYDEALKSLEILREPVGEFFEKVMVNCDDAALRQNRYRLLRRIDNLFAPIAAFNLLQI